MGQLCALNNSGLNTTGRLEIREEKRREERRREGMEGEKREKKGKERQKEGWWDGPAGGLSLSLSSAIVCESALKIALCVFWFLCKSLSVYVQEMAISHYNWDSYFSCLSCLICGN